MFLKQLDQFNITLLKRKYSETTKMPMAIPVTPQIATIGLDCDVSFCPIHLFYNPYGIIKLFFVLPFDQRYIYGQTRSKSLSGIRGRWENDMDFERVYGISYVF